MFEVLDFNVEIEMEDNAINLPYTGLKDEEKSDEEADQVTGGLTAKKSNGDKSLKVLPEHED